MPSFTRRQLLAASALAPFLSKLPAATLDLVHLGVTTDEIDEDLRTALVFLRRFGLSYAELRSIWNKYNTAQPLEKIREAKALLDEYQIKASILSTAFFKIPLPPDNPEGQHVIDEQWTLLEDAMQRAKIVGTDKLRIFAFTYKEGQTPGPSTYPRIYELLRETVRRATAGGFRLALENVGSSYVSTAAEAAALFKAIPDSTLGLTWDPNNAGASGEKAFPDGYRLLDPARIMHVHLRDYRHRPDGKVEWAPVGQGEFDNLGQIRALLKDGFKGTFTLETHWRSPKGKAFSTEMSLTALLKVIENV